MAYCYNLINCANPVTVLPVSSPTALTPGQVVSLLPGEIPLDYQTVPNCWTVSMDQICTGLETPITTVTSYLDCAECLAIGQKCYKLTSCTAGNNTVIYSNLPDLALLSTVEILSYPGLCFKVELITAPCNCGPIAGFTAADILGPCLCTSPYLCFKLQDCTNQNAPYIYVSGNLDPYVGQTVTVAEFPRTCYLVIGVTDGVECDANVPIAVTCIQPCVCSINCYEFTNCLNPAQIIQVNSTLSFALGTVLSPIPAIIPPGGNNCWTVTGVGIQPCSSVYGVTVTAVTDYGPNNCDVCAGPPTCYKLTSCDGLTTVYTQSALGPYVGQTVQSTAYPGQCWNVAVVAQGQPCTNPVVIDPAGISPCTCPCYTLTNCKTGESINSNSNLSTFVGQNVHLDEYGGCQGDCWSVAANPPPGLCTAPVTVTVSTGCTPCGPCGETCYEIVDCQTNAVLVVALNPTLNGVDLSTLVNGQAIGQIVIGQTTHDGCWFVRLGQGCTAAVAVSVYNIYQPTPTQTGCDQCLNSCYALLNCQTLQVDYIIKYTVPNPNGLPNPNAITGTIGNLCFNSPVGCVTGCYIFQLIPGASCQGSVDWTTVVSYTNYKDCNACLPQCYLLTECAPAVTAPFVVNNDLSLYVGSYIKVCDALGVCHCYHVELAQTCDGATTIGNPSAGFNTCDECNACGCPGPRALEAGIADVCQRITTVPITNHATKYYTTQGSISPTYGSLGTRFYANVTSLPYPLTAVTGPDRFIDPSNTNVPYSSSVTGIWGGPAGSRLSTVGIWTTAAPNPLNEWIGFSKCITINTPGTYCVGIGGDDAVRFKLDGTVVAEASIGAFDFNYWHVFELNIQAGTHIIVVEGKNTGGNASFGAEIYQTNITALQSITTSPALQAVTIFSTFPFKGTSTAFQTGQSSGYSCPPGATVNLCGQPSCTFIDTIPYNPCIPTFKVIDCAGVQPDFTTNTDLSAYLVGTYKTCLAAPLDPWPAGCYCVTVQISSSQVGSPFTGVFQQKSYNCCLDCQKVCYLLTDCNRVLTPVVVCNDLADYVGKIIRIEGCGDICWEVSLAENCDNNTSFAGTIIVFEDCQSCLPPVPPPAPPYDLHLRKIKPGYNSPNSCYTTNYIEKVNCSFAEQVYNAMLVRRYGITVCCEEDLNTWDIKKQLMDLDILKDPNMCKSTLCDCPAPCLVDVMLELLPVCANPIVVSVIPSKPCDAPEVTSVKIDVHITSPNCNCYTITPIEGPILVKYIDCCCKEQTISTASYDSISLCGSTLPVVFEGIANVQLNGDCNAPGPCNPPTCYCWKVTNTNPIGTPDGAANFDNCPTSPLSPGVNVTVPAGGTVYSCAFNPPVVTPGLSILNNGICGPSCGPPPASCNCYQIESVATAPCEFVYRDCNGVDQTVTIFFGTTFICSEILPFSPNPCVGVTITPSPYPCDPATGICGPPVIPCVCYKVTVSSLDGKGCYIDYTDCRSNPVSQFFPDGLNYICSKTVPTNSQGTTCPLVVASTPCDCNNCGPIGCP